MAKKTKELPTTEQGWWAAVDEESGDAPVKKKPTKLRQVTATPEGSVDLSVDQDSLKVSQIGMPEDITRENLEDSEGNIITPGLQDQWDAAEATQDNSNLALPNKPAVLSTWYKGNANADSAMADKAALEQGATPQEVMFGNMQNDPRVNPQQGGAGSVGMRGQVPMGAQGIGGINFKQSDLKDFDSKDMDAAMQARQGVYDALPSADEIAAEHENRFRLQQEELQGAEEDIRSAARALEYAGMPMDQVEPTLEIAENAKGHFTREQVQEAQKKLDRAKSIDPSRILGSAGARIIAALGSALGAYGAAMTGTANFAQQNIDNAIKRDIMEQRDRFAKKRHTYQTKKDVYSQLMGKFKDERTAATMAESAMYKAAGFKAQGLAARVGDERIKANLIQTANENIMKGDQLELNALKAKVDARIKKRQLAQTEVNLQMKRTQAAEAMKRAPAGAIRSMQASNEILKEISTLRNFWKGNIEGKSSTIRTVIPGHTIRNEWDVRHRLFARKLARMYEEGKISDDDMKDYRKMVPAVGDWSGTAYDKFNVMEEHTLNKITEAQRIYTQQAYKPFDKSPTQQKIETNPQTVKRARK